MSSKQEGENHLEGDGGRQNGTRKRHFRGHWTFENTTEWARMFLDQQMSAQAIAKEVMADEGTVRRWLKKHSVPTHQGMRRKKREPPRISAELEKLLKKGPSEVLKLLDERVWGVGASASGLRQLTKFCDFVKLPLEVGLTAAAKDIRTDKSMITAWTKTTKQPYLVRVANTALQTSVKPGWKLLPMRLESGGNVQGPWIQVPTAIQKYEDVSQVIEQLNPTDKTFERSAMFGISKEQANQLRSEMFAYLLGMMVGDSGKLGGQQQRFTSTNLSLFFTKKHPDNESLGEFTSMCANALGIEMKRIKDGEPSGATKLAMDPTGSYRWNSQRSPLLAWMFFVGMGMEAGETTRDDPVHMEWIFNTPFQFRKRFIQGLADSDGCARDYVVEICSVPNAGFTTRLLLSIGMSSAYTRRESGKDLRSIVKNTEASCLPIFNEFTGSYRYQQLVRTERD
jgi:hypothetical protein